MTFKNVLIGKPETYSFVRGTSLSNAKFLLFNEFMPMGTESYGYVDEFYLCAHHNFPRTYNFSKRFQASSEEEILAVTKDFAREHAFHDFMRKKFVNIIGEQDFGEFDDAKEFYEYHKEKLHDNMLSVSYSLDDVNKIFFEAHKYRGVNIYFNENLMRYPLFPDPEEDYYQESNSLFVKTTKQVSLDTVIAVEPLGSKDTKELSTFLEYVNKNYLNG